MNPNNKILGSHLSKEVFIIILGNIITILWQYLILYIYNGNPYEKGIIFSIAPYYIMYLVLSGYIISMIFAPLTGIKYKKSYFIFFIVFAIPSVFWLYIFNKGSGFEYTLFMFFILLPLPLSYLAAWRMNSQYWRDKDSKRESAL